MSTATKPDADEFGSLAGSAFLVAKAADARVAAEALEGADLVASIKEAESHPDDAEHPLYGVEVVVLVRQGERRELNAAKRLKAKIGRGLARSFRIASIPGWHGSATLATWMHDRPSGLNTPGALGVWLQELPDLDPDPDPTLIGDSKRGFGGFGGSQDGEIPEFVGPPKPIVAVLRPVPPFDMRLMPAPLQAWVEDIANRMQCAPEFPAVAAVVALAAVLGRKVGIRPKLKDAWTVVANLWAMIVGRPGVLKTPATQEAKRPLDRLIAEAIERNAKDRATFEQDTMIHEARRKAAKDQLEKRAKVKDATDEELRDLAAKASADPSITEPKVRRYQTSDCTVEKFQELLSENPNGLLQYRDELSGWLRSLDREDRKSDRAFYLEGWNGTGGYDCDRIGQGTTRIEAVCISLLGGIQPGPLATYLRQMTSGAGDDGLISRFQLAVFPDQSREFKIVDEIPNRDAKNRAFAIYRVIDALSPDDIGATSDEDDPIPFLRFHPNAQKFFYAWWTELEAKLRADEPPAIESHLAKYRSLMPALALLFHVVDLVDPNRKDQPRCGPVSLDAARRAAAWCALLEEHARRIYQSGTDGDVQPALTLAKRLRSLSHPFTASEVKKKGWAGLGDIESVERALDVLEEHNWIKSVDPSPRRPAADRRRSTTSTRRFLRRTSDGLSRRLPGNPRSHGISYPRNLRNPTRGDPGRRIRQDHHPGYPRNLRNPRSLASSRRPGPSPDPPSPAVGRPLRRAGSGGLPLARPRTARVPRAVSRSR